MTTPNTPGVKRPTGRPKGAKDKKPRFNASVTESFSVRIHSRLKRLFFRKTKPEERRAIVEGWIQSEYEKP